MKYKKEFKIFYVLLLIFSIYVIIILSNMALPILYRYLMSLIYLLSPFIIGFFFAFLLHTIVDKIEEQGINRLLSVLLVFCTFIIIAAYLISSLIPIVFSQISDLEEQIPQIYRSVESFINDFWIRFDFIPEKYHFGMDDIENWTMNNLLNIRFSTAHMSSLLESFNIIVLTPIIIFYFLYDYNHIKIKLKKFLIRHKMRFIYHFIREADEEVGQYFRGLILIMNLMAIVSGIGFFFIGLQYPMLFGFIVGYTNAIPIIGNYIGGVPAVIFALTKSWKLAILTLVIIVVVQLVESNIVTPYVQSKSIDCHPLLILLAFIIFGKYFGILGMIFAIPLLAIIMLFIKYIRIYLRLRRCRN
ncbi:AI-2E family transporter [Mycoplasmatota bacterium]|nr:AI-2E family transporter [Mycoplasmatota bacterium]